MIHINEIIIVEGNHDIAFLSTFLDALFIKTDGSSLPKATIDEIITYKNKGKEFIILTDPDFPGEQIRNKLLEIIPNAKLAFLDKKKARTSKKVGVEHSSKEHILEALNNMITLSNSYNLISNEDLIDLGLNGSSDSKIIRDKISLKLNIGIGNAKQFLKRINCLNINKIELNRMVDDERKNSNSR